MEKLGTANIPCGLCDKDAVKGTNPPRCKEHMDMYKKAALAGAPETLKELENDDNTMAVGIRPGAD